jgi:hypothetical protein
LKNRSIEEIAFANTSIPFNKTLPEWTAVWWKWFHSMPSERNPALDPTGEFWNTAQNEPYVWFLAGTLGGSAIRRCEMPFGKAILFPIITGIFSFVLDPDKNSEEELTEAVTKEIDAIELVKLKLDELFFDDLNNFRVRSEVFDDVIEDKKTRSVSDGYWAFLRPLDLGNHIIHFIGKSTRFFNEVTYHLSVVPDS